MGQRSPFTSIGSCMIAVPQSEGELKVRHEVQGAKALSTLEVLIKVGWICHHRFYGTESRHSQETAVPHQDTHFIPCCVVGYEAQLILFLRCLVEGKWKCTTSTEKSGLPFLWGAGRVHAFLQKDHCHCSACLYVSVQQPKAREFLPAEGGHCNKQGSKTAGKGIQQRTGPL